ncbi:hypothetical protein MAC_02232 [Metarhizium acridum CQMa 102]|uniref:Uncharacterized protein n=1 Tax=Metarhizium acridum (strain CQMa 102) TaxID=655827 RepID=E9DX84_METAQ|nr:uncharacterized protein MAC_02232 [Metarhizium acridum CQMa 102]EFY91642.1 hypothetical protein MAC_02232 [Metarhizium acridum CQMa 102]
MARNFPDENMGRFEMDPMRKPPDASSFHAHRQHETTRRGAVSCGIDGSPYPQGSPNRHVYLAARSFGILCSIALTILASITLSVVPRGKWGAAVLSPCISTLLTSSFEVWCILGANRRSHYWRRVLYDGALGIGYAIAFGFLVSFTRPDISRSDPKAASSAAVGIAILILMVVELLLQIVFTWSGIRELLRIRNVQTSG